MFLYRLNGAHEINQPRTLKRHDTERHAEGEKDQTCCVRIGVDLATTSNRDRLSHSMSDLFASYISVAFDEGTAFKIEELTDLKLVVSVRVEQVAFDYLANFHLLRAIAAKPTEFIIFVSEGGGGVANNFRGKRVGDAYGCIVLRVGHQDRSLNALLIDHAAEEAIHAF
jgi:hypothetical protein